MVGPSSFVLDTNTFSNLMRGKPETIHSFRESRKDEVFVPGPVLAEICYGLERLSKSKKKTELERRYKLFASEIRQMPWSQAVSESFGAIKAKLEKKGTPIEDFDVAIAAHALAAGATLVSSDQNHMRRIIGLRVMAW